MKIAGQRRGETYPEPRASSGSTIRSFSTSITFNMVNGLVQFDVTVPGLPDNAQPWVSLDGPPQNAQPGDIAGVQGVWNEGSGELAHVMAYYQMGGGSTSLVVPIRIF